MEKTVVPIFFTADESYAPWLDCAIRSMEENASEAYKYQIIVLHQDLSEESQRRIASGVCAPFEIRFIPMEKELSGITDRTENRLRCDYFTLTIYFRLFIADRFPEYDKGIYLDSDIVVPGDISELYRMELGDNIIGACADRSIMPVPELVEYVENAVGVRIDQYINSGILLMNLKKMREAGFCDHFLHLLHTFHFDCLAPDQDYINAMCNGKIVYLDEAWDVMPPMGGKEAEVQQNGKLPLTMVSASAPVGAKRLPLAGSTGGKSGSQLNCASHKAAIPKLIHYNLFQKPWCYDDIPYEEYFWDCAKQSPFYQDILRFKENYSEEQKKSDQTCLENMIAKGPMVCRQEVTFRRMFEKGERIRIE
ncbi:MAG: glycosyltransferase family 8 protein [Lachnospiraceae bacterium]|nr:glycosyltransferase family 8 protein [Lachnospiraceae bacterium]